MTGDRCTVSQMADVIMEGLEEYAQLAADDMKKAVSKAGTQARKDIRGKCPCEDRCLCQELGGEDHEGNLPMRWKSWCIPGTGTSWPICWSWVMR